MSVTLPEQIERDTIEKRIMVAKQLFLTNDEYLLRVIERTKDDHFQPYIHERSMTHKFAVALQHVFPLWNVDCEYNRNGDLPKYVDAAKHDWKDKSVLPDIIIHKRGPDKEGNLVIFEAKVSTATAKENEIDHDKLVAYKNHDKLRYKHAVFLTFVIGDRPDITCEFV